MWRKALERHVPRRTGSDGSATGVGAQAREVAEGGDAYPAGVRDLASRLAEDLETRSQQIQILMARSPEPKL